MSHVLRSVFAFLNRDLTGKTWQRRQCHPYFGEMVYYASGDLAHCYWEAELAAPGQTKKVGVTMRGTTEGPEPSEEAFCRVALSDPDALFTQCSEAFEPVFVKWARHYRASSIYSTRYTQFALSSSRNMRNHRKTCGSPIVAWGKH